MADPARARRLAKRISTIVASAIEYEIKDPGLAGVTIVDTKVTNDLHDATVYYTVMGRTLDDEPDYPGAADLKTSAANLRQQYGDVSVFERSNLLWYIAAGALLVLLVGGWVTLLVVRNRRQSRAETETEAAEAAEPVPDDDDSAGTVRSLGLVPPAGPDEPHFCANCGAQHHHTEKFCPNCGKKISLGASA